MTVPSNRHFEVILIAVRVVFFEFTKRKVKFASEKLLRI